MRLTRRDALAVLAGLGITGGAVAVSQFDPPTADADGDSEVDDGEHPETDADLLATMSAAAEVIYPSQAEGIDEFVETYVVGRATDESRRAAIVEAVTELDEVARDWYGAPFAELSADNRDSLLRELGVAAADPVPDGNVSERLRFHVVNELLYAFYSSPTGGRLVGIENPIGHAGGTESYRRATMDERPSEASREDTDG
ncbi:gluconate 2-dehydrogenase subunit 3 family protein [Haloferax mediterranei ATCC 33500]|uniref:Gluconate 2-dehydrogenase subunit 3 family protein n=1 Tax=Haloferax mediterranei (strain ATCC 33500 / DSM 1411 / JCM 8866 / NBRC 14739 / NCIMB 2177 / R-4) TaxID=523841 RepID=I3R4A8_HALMT|nr:gluconate 2-dehydrogenase subunit 3 family protein [Haloferax mediterranei]AFK19068.1 hypothetical protein HFX_1357 [Haloferax mediterranei ATCC 33500]AHZ21572.1 Tat (twin-arginine translocation) pathway signal sequence [Haloferax mediterranei ATCC 33500]EMA04035.1 hypothetical protein C439_03718 [Haloferax mediterranei ATCC 33500]MDX5989160.1 gluconate 2-dehydrogenase subunit 3 family protein [Haloferax mediterranei ATCC 33500]QCQ75541.1 gluconate 2-dehydrogenase subunit 3 family protein [